MVLKLNAVRAAFKAGVKISQISRRRGCADARTSRKGALSALEIETALAAAEQKISTDPARQTKLSDANREAICFPLRFLRLANQTASEGRQLSFSELTTLIGQTKRD